MHNYTFTIADFLRAMCEEFRNFSDEDLVPIFQERMPCKVCRFRDANQYDPTCINPFCKDHQTVLSDDLKEVAERHCFTNILCILRGFF